MLTTFTVTGMTYGRYEQRIADVLADVDDVGDATVNREAGRATVEGDADTDALVTAIEGAGYDANA